ncbi:MAG: hypothetical protein PHF00_12330 [Elusimicrobia bacterium]|nr:hypothetical protein [Elusimicrobiota bacterium]
MAANDDRPATKADLKALEKGLRKDLATKSDMERVLRAIDAFAAKAQGYDRVSALHGHSLTDVEVAVKDHERRNSSLESARAGR